MLGFTLRPLCTRYVHQVLRSSLPSTPPIRHRLTCSQVTPGYIESHEPGHPPRCQWSTGGQIADWRGWPRPFRTDQWPREGWPPHGRAEPLRIWGAHRTASVRGCDNCQGSSIIASPLSSAAAAGKCYAVQSDRKSLSFGGAYRTARRHIPKDSISSRAKVEA
jgi:hypothetical protein